MFAFQSIRPTDSLMLDNIARTMLQVNNIIMGIDIVLHWRRFCVVWRSVVRLANEVSDSASASVRSACKVSGSMVLGRPLHLGALSGC